TTDPDAGDTFTYSLVGGTGATDNASFTIAGNQLKTAASFDFEAKSSYSIRARTTDAGGLFFEKVFTIGVTNVNEAPVAQPVDYHRRGHAEEWPSRRHRRGHPGRAAHLRPAHGPAARVSDAEHER